MSEPAPEMPDGLPELPPVPPTYDRWEERGYGWDSTERCTFASFSANEDEWVICEDCKPGAYIHHFYLEAVRSQPQPDEVQALFNASPDLDDDDGWCEPQPPPDAAPMKCPHCGSGLLWSEDRGAHCDGCDDYEPEDSLPPGTAPEAAREDNIRRILTNACQLIDGFKNDPSLAPGEWSEFDETTRREVGQLLAQFSR
jgi:hypothetical protein